MDNRVYYDPDTYITVDIIWEFCLKQSELILYISALSLYIW